MFAQMSDEQWEGLIPWITESTVAGDLWFRIQSLGVAANIPSQVSEYFQAYIELAAEREFHALSQLKEIDRCLAPTGIELVALKGAAFAACKLYSGAGARLFNDIDVLAPRGELETIARALESIGYVMDWKAPRPLDTWMQSGSEEHAPPFVHPDKRFRVELHQTVHSQFSSHSYPVTSDEILQNAVSLPGYSALKRPSSQHLLIHLFYHNQIQDKVLIRGSYPYSGIADMAALLDIQPAIDWKQLDRTLARVKARGQWNSYRDALNELLPMGAESKLNMCHRELWQFLLNKCMRNNRWLGSTYYALHRFKVSLLTDWVSGDQGKSLIAMNDKNRYTHLLPVHKKAWLRLKEFMAR